MIYVLYHRDTDGLFAAAAAYRTFGDTAKYISVQYGEKFPLEIKELSTEDMVYILDFSYKKDILDVVDQKVDKLLVLDHHKSAESELKDCEYAIFDMDKCGSTLAWEYFNPFLDMPYIYYLVVESLVHE
jgi:oligoribonuclease NrnB/cAMP/cGMP phosphodiesterase (DHH superfamily)